MNRKHLPIVLGVLFLVIFLCAACGSNSHRSHMHTRNSRSEARVAMAASYGENISLGMTTTYGHNTFESAIKGATDVVIVEFVAHRPFNQRASEYEFIVHDRICGNAADTIFVYVVYNEAAPTFADPAFQFTTGTHYLLPLIRRANIYSSFHYDAFMFSNALVLDLENPARSTMRNQPLSLFSDMNFESYGLSREHIISYVRSLPRDPFGTIYRVLITSDNLVDIITGSPYVLVVEITEPIRMSSEVLHTDITSTDIYSVSVVEVLKGSLQVGDAIPVIFFADTVLPGEIHIVSIDPPAPGASYHRFTSRNSLHCITQRDEIIRIIRGRRSNTDPIELPTPTPSPSPTPSPTPEPEPSPTPEPEDEPEVVEDEVFSRFTAALYEPNEAANINLINIEVELPEDFVSDMLLRDDLNDMFLHEEMHSIAVMVDYEAADDILSIITVYVGDLDLSDIQMLMLRGFVIDLDTGEYTVIPGSFSVDRDYFHFEFTGSGIIGAVVYELPTPLLRLNINDYRYYYRGSPLTSDVAPFITQNRTMVPIRLVSEALGATPRWDRTTRTAYIYYNDTVLRLPVGEPLPGEMGTPLLRNNRVLVPLRFVIENFDAFTFWDAGLREVTVFVLD